MNRETSHVPIQQTRLHVTVYVCQKNVIMIAARDIVFNCSIENNEDSWWITQCSVYNL